MRVVKRKAWLAGVAVALVVATLTGSPVRAQSSDLATNPVSTDRSGSIVIFPKVIADGTRDTLIELTNTSNTSPVYAHCIYVNGIGRCRISGATCASGAPTSSCTAGVNDICDQPCTPLDFDLVLTRQQPTIWRVSTGRSLNSLDNDNLGFCDVASPGTPQDCPGFDPGIGAGGVGIPPVNNQPFQGELKCVETDSGGVAMAGNSLKGEATLETLASGQISRYNSFNFFGGPARANGGPGSVDGNQLLELNGDEFSRCPAGVEFVHYSDGATDEVASNLSTAACSGSACTVTTEVTIVPCTEAPELGIVTTTPVQLVTYNEFEQRTGSAAVLIGCWSNLGLDDINAGIFSSSQGSFRKTEILSNGGSNNCRAGSLARACVQGANNGLGCSVNGDCPGGQCRAKACILDADCGLPGTGGLCGPPTGFISVVEEFHASNNDTGTNAQNVHMVGQRAGACQGNLAIACRSSLDCGGGGHCLGDTITFNDTP